MAVTSFEQFKKLAFKEVEIPGFETGQTITVLLKRVGVLKLASSGKIPNSLMSAVNKLFGEGSKNPNKDEVAKNSLDNITEMSQLLELIAKNSLVEPSYEEVGELLTDEQLNAIFEYAQNGIVSLTPIGNE